MSISAMDEVTVLMSWNGIATKRITRNDAGDIVMHDFDAGMYFNFRTFPVDSIVALSEAMGALEAFPQALVIRGAPRVEAGTAKVRRLMENFRTPDRGRRWMLIDLDKIPLPPSVRCALNSPRVREHVIRLLPREFHDVSYHWQLSSSAGFRGNDKVSLHLWFWLDRPVSDADLKGWSKHENQRAGYKLIDPALFHHVQAHYTAAPIFENVINPFPVRSGLVRKKRDEVTLVLPPSSPQQLTKRARDACVSSGESVGFESWLDRIGDHPGGEGFHDPIIRAAASYVGSYGADGTDVDALYERIRFEVLAADCSRHERSYVDRMASREYIVGAIESAIKKFGDQPSARRKSRRVDHVEPYYPAVETEGPASTDALDIALDDFFARAT